jgi:ribokinase
LTPARTGAYHPDMSAKVFVFGSINTDLVVYVEQLPKPGETVSGGTYASHPGGKGANQAVAAARAGAAVEMYGCLGDDALGRERLESLAGTGISTRGVRLIAGKHSGVAVILVDAAGENTIAVAPGANMGFTADGIDLPSPGPGEVWVSLFQNEVPQGEVEKLIVRAREAGHLVAWNLAPTLRVRPGDAALGAVDYLICNRNELAAFTGQQLAESASTAEVERCARIPLAWGVRAVVATLGRQGSMLVRERETLRIEAFPVEAVDTVGAGDCYCGVFAAGLAEGAAPHAALRRASAAAAISATRRGAQPSMPSREEIDGLLRQRGG